jgi:hypothetical protein
MGYAVELQSKRLEVYVQCSCGWMLQGMQRWWYMHKHRNQGGGNGSKMHMCSVVMNWAELLFLEINATTTKAASRSSQSWKEDPTLLEIACLLATFLRAVLQDENQHPKNKQTNKQKHSTSFSQTCARMCLAEWVCKKSAKLAKSTALRSSGLNSSPGKYSSHDPGMAESSAQRPSLDPLDSMTLTKHNQPSKL